MTVAEGYSPPSVHPRTLVRLLVGLLAAAFLLVGAPLPAAEAASTPEQQFLGLINQERTSRGLAALQLSPVVSDHVSRPWSNHMAATNVLAHSGSGPALFDAIARHYPSINTVGENVGYAGSVANLHAALMNSPGHRANILGSSFRYVGLGVAVANNRTWITQSFFNTSDYVAGAAPAYDATQSERYVKALYADFLGRTPDPAGLSHWAGLVSSGTMQRQQVAYSMATTDEWLNRLVNDLYVKTLGRSADPSGLQHWRAQLRAGMPVAEVASRFYASDEYFGRTGSSNSTWVKDLYGKLLQRTADPVGLSFWVDKAQREGRVTVALQFYGSHENLVRRVNSLYSSLMNRSADPSGLATWPGVVAAQGDLSLAAFLASSDEYWNRAQTR